MLRKLSLKALYEDHDTMTLKQRLVYTVVINVCPIVVFVGAFMAFREWVWNDMPVTVNWK